MLQGKYPIDVLPSMLLPKASWRPFPPASDRVAWETLLNHPLNRERRAWLTGKAEALLNAPWPSLPATLYMEFIRNGNRERYETPFSLRRQNLSILVLAECMEYRGRFLDEIANGLWAITEEATWCLPAHAHRMPREAGADPLPRYDLQSVDLFACQTAMVLAEAGYLLRKELKALSPGLCDRLDGEILRRVVEPVETRDDFWWLKGRNNWTSWCSANTLGSALYTLDDPDRLARVTYKLMGAIDRFVARYGADGGCDEGPTYWCVAAGKLLVFLELLESRSDEKINVFDDPKIAAMGRYITRVHLDGPWFANFADASARMSVCTTVTYRFGTRIGAEDIKALALLSARQWQPDHEVNPLFNTGNLIHMLRELFWIPPDARPAPLLKPLHTWFSDLQVMVERESETPGQGLVLAAKGGHNDENHNHNDVGQFILMLAGRPVIVDIGVETYTRQTFSKDRYALWCIRSSGHNVPLVNGVEQVPGRDRAATQVKYRVEGADTILSMNLESAYPAEAGLVSLRRAFVLRRGPKPAVEITDAYERREGKSRVEVPLFTPAACRVMEAGKLLFPCGARSLVMEYDPRQIRLDIAEVPIADEALAFSWGPRLTRISAVHEQAGPKGSYRFVFRATGAEGNS